jgi:agmatinase
MRPERRSRAGSNRSSSSISSGLGKEVGILGGDVMEVAPSLQRTPESAARTTQLAVRYLRETIAAILGRTV